MGTENETVQPAGGEQAAAPKKEKKHRIRKFFADFKAFISKGNIMDLAVAVIIGAAFGAIVTSLVNDVIMPLISLAVGKDVLASLRTVIVPDIVDPVTNAILTPGTFIEWGKFLQTIINFLIIAFVIFIVLRVLLNAQKGLGKMKAWQKKLKKNPELAENPPPEAAAPEVKIESTEDILKDIRKLLAWLAPIEEAAEAEAKAEKKPEENPVK